MNQQQGNFESTSHAQQLRQAEISQLSQALERLESEKKSNIKAKSMN